MRVWGVVGARADFPGEAGKGSQKRTLELVP